MLELKNIQVILSEGTSNEKKILNGLNLKLKEGEFVTLIGTNGAGKSTLLNLIAGETRATRGAIEIDGQNVTSQTNQKRSYQVARVFQDPLLGSCGELTVSENMALAKMRGKSLGFKKALSSREREQFREELRRIGLGLEDRIDLPMNQLSGGQRQAVSLVMCTLSPMKVLLLDEHTSALDPKTANRVMEFTDQIIREKKLTTLMVTHSLAQAIQYGTKTILLHEGRVAREFSGESRASLSPKDLLALYECSI